MRRREREREKGVTELSSVPITGKGTGTRETLYKRFWHLMYPRNLVYLSEEMSFLFRQKILWPARLSLNHAIIKFLCVCFFQLLRFLKALDLPAFSHKQTHTHTQPEVKVRQQTVHRVKFPCVSLISDAAPGSKSLEATIDEGLTAKEGEQVSRLSSSYSCTHTHTQTDAFSTSPCPCPPPILIRSCRSEQADAGSSSTLPLRKKAHTLLRCHRTGE